MNDSDFKAVLDTLSSPVLVLRPVSGENKITDFEVLFSNRAFRAGTRRAGNIVRYYSQFRNFLQPDIPWFEMAERAARKEPVEPITYFSDANHAWFRLKMVPDANGLVVVSFENVTNERTKAQQLREHILHDNLTGLPNRDKFNEDFSAMIDIAQNENSMLALLMLDIDDLKILNNSQGQEQGDSVLRRTALLLGRFERGTIHSYRIGGDEFMVILEKNSTLDTIANTTDAISEAFTTEGIKVSGGISVFPDNTEEKEDLLRFTDIALQHAKADGKNRLVYFTPDMQKLFIQKLNMQTRLTAAVLADGFRLEYQPQFDIKTNELRGFEALLRWHDSELGDVSPSVFIPLAEETGLILPIGKWVMEHAFAMLKTWQTAYNFTGVLSINVSPLQLKQVSFVSDLEECLRKYELPPASVEIEVTESVMIDHMEEAVEKLSHIKNLGIRVSLDDFGTGYSSLNYLQQLPLDTLKIDKSFINNITAKDGIQANITNSIIMMVQKMGLDTIAEGVEKNDQYELLKRFNCNIVQGFLRGKPMAVERCNAYLSGDKSALLSLEEDGGPR